MSSDEKIKSNVLHMKNKDESSLDEDNEFDELLQPRRKPNLKGLVTLGAGVAIGSGIGLIFGITTAAMMATASKVVAWGVVPKITGVIGGAAGLRWGLRKYQRNGRLDNSSSKKG